MNTQKHIIVVKKNVSLLYEEGEKFFFFFFEGLYFRLCFPGYPQQQLIIISGRIADNFKGFCSFIRDEFNKFQIFR